MTRLPILLPLIALLGCAPFPEVGPLPDASGAPPSLLPMDEVLAQAPSGRISASTGEALAARAARLQNRARLMQGPVLDPATRARLAAAIAAGRA
ncbi:hypothetical protein [Rhodobacter sp. 24-YEA-8]|uniref:hypothetical protein n=1 Tax=Rhodobacter sp. 24-YEA-8 TaxID=1884310 RepID=UPI00089B80A7|nr:hypothetical protein [Rhodobacter sp. 24-YEA-8]SEC13721.1 hypothetical protein SAMN05519105_2020 [Rhodobacter sp. 24-YEA-8]